MGRIKKSKEDKTSGAGESPAPSPSHKYAETQSFIQALRKKLEKGGNDSVVHIMGEDNSVITRPKFLSTGHVGLDSILRGGLPAGRITEIYSKNEGEGKSSLAAQLMAEMQRAGGVVILIDTEQGFTEERLTQLGVDTSTLLTVEPAHIEAVFKTITGVMKGIDEEKESSGVGVSDKVLIVWDSVAATPSEQQFDADFDQSTMASQARALSAGLQKLQQTLSKHECYLVLLNQTRHKINAMFGEQVQTAGGKAVKFYASTRLELSKGPSSVLKLGDQILGFKVTVKTVKSRIARPQQTAIMHLLFEEGFDNMKGFFDYLISKKLLEQKGAWYSFGEDQKSFQQKDFEATLKALPKEMKKNIADTMKQDRISTALIRRLLGNGKKEKQDGDLAGSSKGSND